MGLTTFGSATVGLGSPREVADLLEQHPETRRRRGIATQVCSLIGGRGLLDLTAALQQRAQMERAGGVIARIRTPIRGLRLAQVTSVLE